MLMLFFRPVDEMQPVCGSGEGSVKPSQVIGIGAVGWQPTLVEEDVVPLTSLCFVAGDGVGIFYLYGVVVRIFSEFFQLFFSVWKFGIIFKNALEELLRIGVVEGG